MPDARTRRTAVIVATLAATLILVTSLPTVAAAKEPPGIAAFMKALGTVESGGRYTARNSYSGAYGKYQIMPYMWRAWARIYLGNANLRATPANQERLAKAVLTKAYWKFGTWPVVAHYWLTGRAERERRTWSTAARRYVAKVMDYYTRYGGKGGLTPGGGPVSSSTTRISDTSAAIRYRGGWSTAFYPSYSARHVRWSTVGGATATLTFTGTAVTLVGPKGPTRGRASILVDGTKVATVDLYSRRFVASSTLFSKSFATRGSHTLTVEVIATRARPVVAIDTFLVKR